MRSCIIVSKHFFFYSIVTEVCDIQLYLLCFTDNPFIPSGFIYLYSLDRFISNKRGVWLVFNISMFYRNFCKANSVGPDQTPRSAASDLGLHCLPMSLLWDGRHKRVNDLYNIP